MLSLPFEIRLIIFSILRPSDLAQVARVCSSFLPIARYIIYQDLCLREDDPSLPLTLDVLKDKDIASCVQILRFRSSTTDVQKDPSIESRFPTTEDSGHWSASLLSTMTGLLELTLIGCPFVTSREQCAFASTIRRCCPLLRTFTYRPDNTTFPEDSMDFDIGGLQKITWYTPYALIHENPAISLISASLTSLTDLRILNCNDQAVSYNLDKWKTLLSFRFPFLTSLSIGYHPSLHSEMDLWIQFLVDHPLLQHFSFGADLERARYVTMIAENTCLVKEDFLPRLRYLETHHVNIRLLAQFGVRSLRQITSLTVLKAYFVLSSSSIRTFDLLDDIGGLPSVINLRIEIRGDSITLGSGAQLNERLARAFPAVESWSSNMQLGLDKNALAAFFAPYKNLGIIEAPRIMVLSSPKPLSSPLDIADHFGPLSTHCPNLREIYVPESGPVSERNKEGMRYIIARRHEGEEGQKINVCLHSL